MSMSKFFKFKGAAADISGVTLKSARLLDWLLANILFIFDCLYISNKISRFFGYGFYIFFDQTIKLFKMGQKYVKIFEFVVL